MPASTLIKTRPDGTQFVNDLIAVRTRTGKKVHAGSCGSSTTHCGVWLKVNGSAMAFPKASLVKALERGVEITNPSALGPRNLVLCEKCFSPEARTVSNIEDNYSTVDEVREAQAIVTAHNDSKREEL